MDSAARPSQAASSGSPLSAHAKARWARKYPLVAPGKFASCDRVIEERSGAGRLACFDVAARFAQQHGALNAVVLFNTLYTDAAVRHLAVGGFPITDDLVAGLSPLQYDHINSSAGTPSSGHRPQHAPAARP